MHTMGFAKRRLVYVVAQRALENFPGEADPAVARCIFGARVLLFAQDRLPEFVLNLVAKQVAVLLNPASISGVFLLLPGLGNWAVVTWWSVVSSLVISPVVLCFS